MARETTDRRHRAALEAAMGELSGWLGRDEVGEVMVNPAGDVWVDSFERGVVETGLVLGAGARRRLLAVIAGQLGRVVDTREPVLEGILPGTAYRVEGVLPPVAAGPCLAIRKPAERIHPLADYLEAEEGEEGCEEVEGAEEALPEAGFGEAIAWALARRRNLLVVGGTSSAKTSFLSSLLEHLRRGEDPSERVFLLEDTAEIQCRMKNRVALQTSPEVDLARLVRISLRMRPDRIFVGEVRGAEALPMLKAWNTGHEGGAATVHANSAREGLLRLEELVAEGGSSPQRPLIARTIDLIVFLKRIGPRRRLVREVLHVLGLEGGDYHLQPVRREL